MAAVSEDLLNQEEEIDKLKMAQANRMARDRNINLDGCDKLPVIKSILKLYTICRGRSRESAISYLSETAKLDDIRRQGLAEIYNDAIKHSQTLAAMSDPIVDQLNKTYVKFCAQLEKQRDVTCTKHAKAPVMVLGETGAGKSSFINLLLGEDVLPYSLLSNTHVICEIMWGRSEQFYAVMHKMDDEEEKIGPLDKKLFIEKLKQCVQAIDENTKKPTYKRAQIYLPCEVLKSGMVIVDSPGIGDTKEMTDMVLNYILEACTFIYIINSTSAGGVQARLQDLLKHVYEKAVKDQKEYRPQNAIFICNKWDQVPCGERKEVWKDTVAKLQKCWPVKDVESCIFRLSTTEETFIQSRNGILPQFEKIMERINTLVPLGHEILAFKGYSFLNGFVNHCLHYLNANLEHVKMDKNAREEKRKMTHERLCSLKENINKFFDEQVTFLRSEIKDLAKNLKEFIQKSSNMDRLCRFADSQVPRQGTWKETAVEIRAHVYKELLNIVQEWEEDNGEFDSVGKNISEALGEEFPKFDAEIYEAQQMLSSSVEESVPTFEPEMDEVEEFSAMPPSLKRTFKKLDFAPRVALGIGLAPFLMVTLAVRLPVYGFRSLKRSVDNYMIESRFKVGNDPKRLAEEYAKSTVEVVTDNVRLEKVIEDDLQPVFRYLSEQKQRMQDQIKSDIDLLRKLKEEERSVEDITKTYEPLHALFMILQRRLKHFLILHMPTGREALGYLNEIRYNTIDVTNTVICSGLTADIIAGTSNDPAKTGNFASVSLRRPQEPLKPQHLEKYLLVESAYRTIKKPHIVSCVAVTVMNRVPCQVLQPLQSSLRQHLYTQHMREQIKHNKRNTILKIVKDVVSGLRFLHDKKLVHFDLSMDTIAVDRDGEVKITNIVNADKLVFPPKACSPIRLVPYIYINPDLLSVCFEKGKANYKTIDDMYAIGVMMWELATGQQVCQSDLELSCENEEHFAEEFLVTLYELRDKLRKNEVEEELKVELQKDWWSIIQQCLNKELTSTEWMKKWQGSVIFPPVILITP